MVCLRYGLGLSLALASIIFAAHGQSPANPPNISQDQNQTLVTLRWGVRPGVSRYRLQLAQDAAFSDIVFDRVINGHEHQITDLTPGRYFWRVAALGAKRGDFSSAGVIDVRANSASTKPPDPKIDRPKGPVTNVKDPVTNTVKSRAGWNAAIGNVSGLVLAHLRSPGGHDLVAATTNSRVIALDAATGVALWTARTRATNGSGPALAPLAIRTRNGLDHVVILTSNTATMLDGRSGREIWRATLPGYAAGAVVLGSRILVIDSLLQKLFVIDGNDGKLVGQAQLPRRAVGTPALLDSQAARGAVIALDDGRLQVFDHAGKLIRSGDAGSAVTTSPLFVRGTGGGLILVGTRNGLTALSAEDLRPLGRVSLKDDAPQGTLFADDLDGDGVAEVVMFTNRGRVVVVKSDEGKIVWEADAGAAAAVAFADINADRVLDLLLAGKQGFAFALSGRDGTLIWKDGGATGVASNHSAATLQRSVMVAPSASGVLLIAGDQFGSGVRAFEFARATPPRK